MQYGCIGEKLGHSYSAEIHAMLSEHRYELREVAKDELDAFMKARDFFGINVTIPYKKDVIPYLHEIDRQAKEIGAVNTVVNRDGLLYGYNTDFYGMSALFSHIGVSLNGKKVAILGTGGTSLTAMAVSRHFGAREILRVSRREREHCITYEELKEYHRDTEVIINTTPCGMYPHAQETPIDLEGFDNLSCVADAIYNPLRTCLVSMAKERGIPSEGGLFMLVAQAVRASEIFLGVTYPENTVERIWKTLERQKENIVLIGMPGSGKTTVGKLLSESVNREVLDMDKLLTKEQGRTPAEIIREDGEPAFRNMETALLRDTLAHVTGKIISTGGGVILREENRRMLRQNGRVYLLDRPWQNLLPTDDRPLSSTVEAIKKRYMERRDAYLRGADVRVEDPASAADAAEMIRKDFCG